MQLCQKNIKYKQYLHCIKNILCRFSELANSWQFLKYIQVNQKSLEKKKNMLGAMKTCKRTTWQYIFVWP